MQSAAANLKLELERAGGAVESESPSRAPPPAPCTEPARPGPAGPAGPALPSSVTPGVAAARLGAARHTQSPGGPGRARGGDAEMVDRGPMGWVPVWLLLPAESMGSCLPVARVRLAVACSEACSPPAESAALARLS